MVVFILSKDNNCYIYRPLLQKNVTANIYVTVHIYILISIMYIMNLDISIGEKHNDEIFKM